MDLIDKLTIIPSEQTADLRYSGLAEQDAVYALQTNVAWANFINPGQVPPTDDAWTAEQSRTARNLHTAQKLCYDSESNVRRAINAALNTAIPRTFRRVPGDRMGVRTFRPTDDPKQILNTLRSNYGRMTPLEKSAMEKRWSEQWNPNEPIENFFDRLEDCYVQSITQPPAYTSEQMVDKALTAIQTTGLFPTAILEWNGFMDAHQTWPEFKSHFQEAYELQLQSGGFNGNNPYHGAANAFTDGDDSIDEINESITNIHRAHNANTEATSTEMAAL